MRIILFTGKGGSGASTLAAATAVAAARGEHRTLAFGFGPGLGAALGSPLGGEPCAVADNLSALEARYRPHEADPFRDWLRDLLDWRNMDVGLAHDLAALPGLSYVGRLLHLESLAEEGDFDVIVVDSPPLGHCLDLLASLDAAVRWLDRLFPVRQPSVFEPFLRALTAYGPSGEDVYERGRELLLRLGRLRGLLSDPEVTSVRLVLPPDRSALGEVQGAVAALSLFAHPVDVTVVNRLLPAEVTDGFFQAARAEQAEVSGYISKSMAPVPVLTADLQPQAPSGLEALAGLASAVYGRHDPSAVLHRGPAHAFSQEDGHHVLSLALPFARREELGIEQTEEGILVRLGDRQRPIPLPQEMRHLDAVSSSFDGSALKVVFGYRRAGEDAR